MKNMSNHLGVHTGMGIRLAKPCEQTVKQFFPLKRRCQIIRGFAMAQFGRLATPCEQTEQFLFNLAEFDKLNRHGKSKISSDNFSMYCEKWLVSLIWNGAE